jgi:hypothetical protein
MKKAFHKRRQEEMRSGNQRVVNTKDFTESPVDVLLRTDGMD